MQNWAWPHTCLLCGDPGATNRHFCPGCMAALPWLQTSCRRCANALPVSADSCGNCQQQTFAFERVHACFRYRSPVDTLIHRLKYGHKLALARALGETWAPRLVEDGLGIPDLLVPVPLHTTRLRERGFNQALEIARPLVESLDISLAPDAIVRTRATPPQAGLTSTLRARNVRNAFEARHGLAGKSVALIDDVMTTGHTADAAARALLRAGARSVCVWVLARA